MWSSGSSASSCRRHPEVGTAIFVQAGVIYAVFRLTSSSFVETKARVLATFAR